MKIVIDKVQGPPPHALSREDLWAIVNAVPEDWDLPSEMHLKATLPEHSAFDRPVVHVWPRMNVCSRGLTARQARKEILRELARGSHRGHMSDSELAEIDRIIAPILAKVESALAGEVALPRRDDKRWHRACRALEAAGISSSDAFAILWALEAERQQPTSKRLPAWVAHGQQVLREAGIDPDDLAKQAT